MEIFCDSATLWHVSPDLRVYVLPAQAVGLADDDVDVDDARGLRCVNLGWLSRSYYCG